MNKRLLELLEILAGTDGEMPEELLEELQSLPHNLGLYLLECENKRIIREYNNSIRKNIVMN